MPTQQRWRWWHDVFLQLLPSTPQRENSNFSLCMVYLPGPTWKYIKINQTKVNISVTHGSYGRPLFFPASVCCISGEYSELLLCTAQGQGKAVLGGLRLGGDCWIPVYPLMIWPGGSMFSRYETPWKSVIWRNRLAVPLEWSSRGYLIGLGQCTSDVIEALYVLSLSHFCSLISLHLSPQN